MKISSLFQQRELKPAWSYTTAGILWRLLFSHSNFILGEDRNTEKKEVSFFCLNAGNGDVLWKEASFGESWWIGLEGVIHDKLFLHGFRKPDMPEHSKIIVVDLGTGKELWRNNNYAFLYATGGKVIAYRDLFERRIFYELDSLNGEVKREFGEAPADAYEKKSLCHGRSDLSFPVSFQDGDQSDPRMRPIVDRYCRDGELRGNVEYVRVDGNTVFNFHTFKGRDEAKNLDDLQNRIVVVHEEDGKQLYTDIVNSSTPTPVPDSFFVDGSTVYYVKEKQTLIALPLARRS